MIQLKVTGTLEWVGDGVGQMSVPIAQVLTEVVGGPGGTAIVVPGGNSPSTGNISTACSTAATALAAAFNANITQIQGWVSGNP